MKRSLLIVLVVACAHTPAVRFANQPVVEVVDDRRDVPIPPKKRPAFRNLYHYDGVFHRPLARALDLTRQRRALGVNALDDVPDSMWFTNRIGIRDVSLDELRAGPASIESPELHTPWTILGTKVGGKAIGFVIRDARGIKHILKLEARGYPELETAADAITSRLLWVAGYNVPDDRVVLVHPRDLVLAPDAKQEDVFGNSRRLARDDVDRKLALCEVESDGRLRGIASRFVEGKLLGGHPSEGRRTDDPNDLIPHELRRDLRGAYPIFAWLDHVDVKETNTLDVWVGDGRKHYVKHFLIDFGKSLGAMTTMNRNLRSGYEFRIDFGGLVRSFVSGGLLDRVWEHRRAPALRGVGTFDASTYDPSAWKMDTPVYLPFLVADARDKFWGAKLAMRFTPEQIRAAVETGRLSDPRAADYIAETLIARQRKTALYWFEQTSALDRFVVDGDTLCFDDLTIAYELIAESTTYVIARRDRGGRRIGSTFALHSGERGRVCVPLGLARDADGYTIFQIRTVRTGRSIEAHVARGPDGPRVIGIWRP